VKTNRGVSCVHWLKSQCANHAKPIVDMMVEHWDRFLFRDYLIAHPDVAGSSAAFWHIACVLSVMS